MGLPYFITYREPIDLGSFKSTILTFPKAKLNSFFSPFFPYAFYVLLERRGIILIMVCP